MARAHERRTEPRQKSPRASTARAAKPMVRPTAETPSGPTPAHATVISSREMISLRDIFWSNVIRDMLNGLSMLLETQPELFDGRFGVLTRHGERIPIAHVHPLFACSVPGTQAERDVSAAVQCTVFRITTPEGEVFTLPVQEIRAIHTMTPELIEKLQALAENEAEGGEESASDAKPFGLAAFTALPKPPTIAAPEHPTE